MTASRNEEQRLEGSIAGKVIARVRRHRATELTVEFSDGSTLVRRRRGPRPRVVRHPGLDLSVYSRESLVAESGPQLLRCEALRLGSHRVVALEGSQRPALRRELEVRAG